MSDAKCAFLPSSTNGRLAFARVFMVVGLGGSGEAGVGTGGEALKAGNG